MAFSCASLFSDIDPSAQSNIQVGAMVLGWSLGMLPAFFIWIVIGIPLYLLSRVFRSGETMRVLPDASYKAPINDRQDPRL